MQVLCAVLLTITQGVIGFNSAGFNKAAMIVTRLITQIRTSSGLLGAKKIMAAGFKFVVTCSFFFFKNMLAKHRAIKSVVQDIYFHEYSLPGKVLDLGIFC